MADVASEQTAHDSCADHTPPFVPTTNPYPSSNHPRKKRNRPQFPANTPHSSVSNTASNCCSNAAPSSSNHVAHVTPKGDMSVATPSANANALPQANPFALKHAKSLHAASDGDPRTIEASAAETPPTSPPPSENSIANDSTSVSVEEQKITNDSSADDSSSLEQSDCLPSDNDQKEDAGTVDESQAPANQEFCLEQTENDDDNSDVSSDVDSYERFADDEPSLDGIFPDEVWQMLGLYSKRYHCTQSIFTGAFLTLEGSLIGRKRMLTVAGFEECAHLNILSIGEPSVAKSRSIEDLLKFENEIDEEYLRQYGEGVGLKPEKKKVNKGTSPRVRFKGTTAHTFAKMAAYNPQGTLMTPDEGSAFFDELKKNSTYIANFESAFDGGRIELNRDNQNNSVLAKKSGVGSYITIQPEKMYSCFNRSHIESGFLSRIITIWGKRAEGICLWPRPEIGQKYNELLRTLTVNFAKWQMLLTPNGELEPQRVKMTKDAEEYLYGVLNELEVSITIDEDNQSLYARMRTVYLRFCLILHCIKSVLQGRDGLDPVSAETARQAHQLLQWALWHQKKTWALYPKVSSPDQYYKMGQVSATITLMRTLVGFEKYLLANGNKIPTQQIADKMRETMPNISNEQVGHMLKKLLRRKSIPNLGPERTRGFMILPEEICSFRAALGGMGYSL